MRYTGCLLASVPVARGMFEFKEVGAAQQLLTLDTGTLKPTNLPHCGSCKDIQRKTWSSFGTRRMGRAERSRGQRKTGRRETLLPSDGPQISATKGGRRRAALALGAAEKVQCPVNAARERSRVRTLHQAFLALQAALPTVPPDTKLSKLDVLLLATSYIAHLSRTLEQGLPGPRIAPTVFLHPLKKWPMRSCLYASSWTGGIPTPTPFAVFSGWPQPRLEARGATL
ncbi:transcription factor 23 isoform X1 [Sphaerodactylus townsendi]|uniref:transcription factor 23 isoform X1 n=1 Tax=Sphaerodactylus townsendi TaxID=933632 RepID=UPI002026E450|nr:transcription factor 23 isoform X1 [Sphaerodactylus townsendi]